MKEMRECRECRDYIIDNLQIFVNYFLNNKEVYNCHN